MALLDVFGRSGGFILFRKIELGLFFPLSEPDERDDHIVFADGGLLSPGCEEPKRVPTIEATEGLRRMPCIGQAYDLTARLFSIGRWF